MPQLPASVDGLALFLDFDGTLVDLAPRPDLVHLPEPVRVSLRTLADLTHGALAIVTGRPLLEVDEFLSPLHVPIAGLHGAERRATDGVVHSLVVDHKQVGAMRSAAEALVESYPGLLLEDKGVGIAIHYRLAPEFQQAARRFAISQVAAHRRSFAVQPGKMVYEIKPRGMDKGSAVAAFMTEALFRGKTPVFVGDDLTDEKGFAAVHRLGGVSIKVGDGPTRAQLRLPNVEAMHGWLAVLARQEIPSNNNKE